MQTMVTSAVSPLCSTATILFFAGSNQPAWFLAPGSNVAEDRVSCAHLWREIQSGNGARNACRHAMQTYMLMSDTAV